jgi:NADPH:quinone reductase-like Zn-dependent oxidoreductase
MLVGTSLRHVLVRRYSSALPRHAATELFYERSGPIETVLRRRPSNEIEFGTSLPHDAVHVELLAFPLTPFDVASIERGFRDAGVAGTEGVARVVAAGSESTFQKGDLVLALPAMTGTWRDYATVSDAKRALVAVPSPLRQAIEAKVPGMLERAATLLGAPALAYRLLEDNAVQPGETVLQNDAGGAVGLALVQLANMRGIKTVSIVENEAFHDDDAHLGFQDAYAVVAERIKALGGDVAVSSTFAQQTARLRELVAQLSGSHEMPRVAFNGAGGTSATQMLHCLRQNGTMVTYGGRRAPHAVVAPTSAFVERELVLKGFNLMHWLERTPREQIQTMVDVLGHAMVRGTLTGWLESKPFSTLEAAEIASARNGTRPRQLVAITKVGESYVQSASS